MGEGTSIEVLARRSDVLAMDEQQFRSLQALAEIVSGSKMFTDAASVERAAVKVLAGRELGLGPIESLRAFHVVEGKVEMSADLLAQRVKQHEGYDYRVLKLTDTECELVFFQDGQECGHSTFNMNDAKRAKLLEKTKSGNDTPWHMYPRNMLFARAMSNGVAWFCPDVAGGARVFVEGEIAPEVFAERIATATVIDIGDTSGASREGAPANPGTAAHAAADATVPSSESSPAPGDPDPEPAPEKAAAEPREDAPDDPARDQSGQQEQDPPGEAADKPWTIEEMWAEAKAAIGTQGNIVKLVREAGQITSTLKVKDITIEQLKEAIDLHRVKKENEA